MVTCVNYDDKDILCQDCVRHSVGCHQACYKSKEEKTMKSLSEIALSYKGKTRKELGLLCEETCAEFVSLCLKEAGYTQSSISCNELFKQLKEDTNHWDEPDDWMKPNDVIFFEWDGTMKDDRPLDHVGIVQSVTNDKVYYVNINGEDHDRVTLESMYKESSYIAYWLRPLQAKATIEKIVVHLSDGTVKVFR